VRDEALCHITASVIGQALDGFPLSLADGWDEETLAGSVREALALTLPSDEYDPARLSNAELKGRLHKLSSTASRLNEGISEYKKDIDHHLSDHSFHSEGFVNYIGFILTDTTGYSQFLRFATQLPLIVKFLEEAACNVERQAPKWRQAKERELRIWRAERLIPIFETAFGSKITVNNWTENGGDPRHRKPTPFMVFYQRMMALAFSEQATSDLSAILKEARTGRKRWEAELKLLRSSRRRE
jgi:hypothetical protein